MTLTTIDDELARFRAEVLAIVDQLVLPSWGTERRGYPHTLYGVVSRALSYVDLLSLYWQGPGSGNQSTRMVAFMAAYFGHEHRAHSIAVQVWRHKLMHTAYPRVVRDPKTNQNIRWLLHWHQHLPPDQHFTLLTAGSEIILNLGAVYLIDDIRRAAVRWASDASSSPVMAAAAKAAQQELDTYELRQI